MSSEESESTLSSVSSSSPPSDDGDSSLASSIGLPDLKPSPKTPLPLPKSWRMDPVRYLTPFNLGTVAIAPVLMGLGGVYIGALSWRRLGKTERFWSTLIGGTLAIMSLNAAMILLATHSSSIVLQFPILSFGVSAMIVGFVIARMQRRDYLAWLANNDGKRPTLRGVGGYYPYIAAIVLGIMFAIVYSFLFPIVLSFIGVLFSLAPDRSFSGDGIEIKYPILWTMIDETQARIEACPDGPQVTCVFLATHPIYDALFRVYRFDNLGITLDEMDAALVESIEQNIREQLRWQEPVTRQFAGRTAVNRRYSGIINGGRFQGRNIVMANENAIFWFGFFYDASNEQNILAQIDRIMNSVVFVDQ